MFDRLRGCFNRSLYELPALRGWPRLLVLARQGERRQWTDGAVPESAHGRDPSQGARATALPAGGDPDVCAMARGAAVRRFFERAIDQCDVPEKTTIDKSGANTSAVRALIGDSGASNELRQSKYLSNIVERDYRAIRRRVRPMLGFKSFWSGGHDHLGHRDHAHGQRGAVDLLRRPSHVRCRPVLQPRGTISARAPALARHGLRTLPGVTSVEPSFTLGR